MNGFRFLPAAAAALALILPSRTAGVSPGAPPRGGGYGVFLSVDDPFEGLGRISGYRTVVIDAMYFDREDVDILHRNGQTVLSYLNVGSLESFRPWHSRFADILLGPYENWDEESWVDVSDGGWQAFVAGLAAEYIGKGVDGFFVDNCDVYWEFPSPEIYFGLSRLLESLSATGKKVVVNGGDAFVREYWRRNGSVAGILTGINQETVFTAIDFETGRLTRSDPEDFRWYMDYLRFFAETGADIYLLEYTRDAALADDIARYCARNGWLCYVSDSIELD